MAILVDSNTRVLVQGITGKVGSFQTRIMIDYGTNIVAGVTPGKGGTQLNSVPIYDFIEEALVDVDVDVALCFVPARFAKEAAFEAIAGRIPLLVLTTADIPTHDLLTILDFSALNGTHILGPDTPGLVSPGKCKVGVHPNRVLKEGSIGVVSKSGALSYEVCKLLTENYLGQSTVVGIGGGPLWDITQKDALEMFETDPQTKAIVLLGEIGGTMEHEAAAFIKDMTKPVVSLIVGRSAPRGTQMGHAGAIIEGGGETAESKIEALRREGSHIAANPTEILTILKHLGA